MNSCQPESNAAPVGAGDAPSPQRVVVIGPSSSETLAWLGLEDHIVGVSDFCSAPELASVPRVGGQLDPNLERITALQPDLLIVQGSHPRLQAWCEQNSTPMLAWKTQSVEAWREEVRAYGTRFEQVEQAEAKLAEWDRRYFQLQAAAGSPEVESSPPQLKVLIVASRDSERITRVLAAGRGSFLGELLEHVGGAKLYADHERDYFDLAEETLFHEQPELILELGGVQSDAERLALWQDAFSQLPAVKHACVFGLQEDYVFLPGPRMLDTAQLLADKLQIARRAHAAARAAQRD